MKGQSLRSEFALILLCFVTGVGLIVALNFDTAGRVEADLQDVRDHVLPWYHDLVLIEHEVDALLTRTDAAVFNRDRDALIAVRADAIQVGTRLQAMSEVVPGMEDGLLRLVTALDRFQRSVQQVVDARRDLGPTPTLDELHRAESALRSNTSYAIARADRHVGNRLAGTVQRNAVQARTGLAIGLTATLLLLLVVLSVLKRILRRLDVLSRFTEQVSRGELEVELDPRSLGRNEIGALGEAFVEMTRGLRASTVSRNYVDNILRSMADALLVLDADLRVRSVNRAGERMLGYRAEDLRGRSLAMVLGHPRAIVAGMIAICENLFDDSREGVELQLIARDGARIPVSFSGSLLEQPDGTRFIVGVAQDITARKQIEAEMEGARREAEEASAAKDQFLANVSHELRTPLNHILGMTEILQNTALTEDQQDYVRTAGEAGQSLLEIIDQLLEFAQLSTEEVEFTPVECSLRSVLEEAVGAAGDPAEEKALELTLHVDPALPERVIADPRRLRQVVDPLLDNALRFTERGGVHVLVTPDRGSTSEGAAPGTVAVHLTVRDTGVGIPPEKQQLIFEAFRQSEDSFTREHGGTGLGLSIARSIVERMGGTMSVESEVGHGSAFHATLLLRSASGDHLGPAPGLPRHQQRGDAVIIEPLQMSRLTLARTIQGWGMRTHAVKSGQEALDEIRDLREAGHRVAVVICAANLPETELASLIEAMGRGTSSRPPVVRIAPGSRLLPQLERDRLGISAEICRPVLPSVLLAAIRYALETPLPEWREPEGDSGAESRAA